MSTYKIFELKQYKYESGQHFTQNHCQPFLISIVKYLIHCDQCPPTLVQLWCTMYHTHGHSVVSPVAWVSGSDLLGPSHISFQTISGQTSETADTDNTLGPGGVATVLLLVRRMYPGDLLHSAGRHLPHQPTLEISTCRNFVPI